MSESAIQQRIRMAISKIGARVFRNQTGLYRLNDGRTIRSGLCVGSSDLIGFAPVTITPDMVGKKVAVFVAIEVKQPGRKPTPQQVKFLKAVEAAGGIGTVAHSDNEAVETVLRFSQQSVNS